MKLIAQRRFQDGDHDIEIGDTLDVTEARGKELLAIGNLVTTAEAQPAETGDRPNINASADEARGAQPAVDVNPPSRKPGHGRKTKVVPGPSETK